MDYTKWVLTRRLENSKKKIHWVRRKKKTHKEILENCLYWQLEKNYWYEKQFEKGDKIPAKRLVSIQKGTPESLTGSPLILER